MTLGCGKTFHPNLPPNFDEPHSCAATLDTPSCPDPPSIPPCTAQHNTSDTRRALVAGSQEMPYFPLIGQKCNGPKGPGTWPDAAIVTPKSDKFCGVDAP